MNRYVIHYNEEQGSKGRRLLDDSSPAEELSFKGRLQGDQVLSSKNNSIMVEFEDLRAETFSLGIFSISCMQQQSCHSPAEHRATLSGSDLPLPCDIMLFYIFKPQITRANSAVL